MASEGAESKNVVLGLAARSASLAKCDGAPSCCFFCHLAMVLLQVLQVHEEPGRYPDPEDEVGSAASAGLGVAVVSNGVRFEASTAAKCRGAFS